MSASLRRSCLHYAHTFLMQTRYTALANASGKLEERLARRLLMADDRVDGDELRLTHEGLAKILAAQRPGVTLAMQELERRRLIGHARHHYH
jgi:CRP-like cAMP-binding protein